MYDYLLRLLPYYKVSEYTSHLYLGIVMVSQEMQLCTVFGVRRYIIASADWSFLYMVIVNSSLELSIKTVSYGPRRIIHKLWPTTYCLPACLRN